jgi:DNA-damage-inducible protein J
MNTKPATICAAVPPAVKVEAAAVLAAHGISMAELLRGFLGRVAARDAATLAWLEKAKAGQQPRK